MKNKPKWKIIVYSKKTIIRYFYDYHFAVNWANRTSYNLGYCPVDILKAQ